jgi:hypothetical protein
MKDLMDDTAIDLDQTEEESGAPEITDEALEAAASTEGQYPLGLSFNFSSYHLQCC